MLPSIQGSMGQVNQYKSSFLGNFLLDSTKHTYSKLSFDMTFHNPSNNFVTWPSMYITWNMVERKKNENKWFAQPLETSLIVKARGKVVRLEVKNIKEFLSLPRHSDLKLTIPIGNYVEKTIL